MWWEPLVEKKAPIIEDDCFLLVANSPGFLRDLSENEAYVEVIPTEGFHPKMGCQFFLKFLYNRHDELHSSYLALTEVIWVEELEDAVLLGLRFKVVHPSLQESIHYFVAHH